MMAVHLAGRRPGRALAGAGGAGAVVAGRARRRAAVVPRSRLLLALRSGRPATPRTVPVAATAPAGATAAPASSPAASYAAARRLSSPPDPRPGRVHGTAPSPRPRGLRRPAAVAALRAPSRGETDDRPPHARTRAAPRKDRPSDQASGWFRAFWRWHFYASFLVVPVLLVLATTGLIYLFRFQLEPLLTPDLMQAEPASETQPWPAVRRPARRGGARLTPTPPCVSMAEPREEGRQHRLLRGHRGGGRPATSTSTRTAPRCSARWTPTGPLSGSAVRLHARPDVRQRRATW